MDVLIVAKESTLPIASVFYDEIESSFKKLSPFILFITPLDEIILKSQIKKNFKNKRLLRVAPKFFEYFQSSNWEEQILGTLPNTLELIEKEIPSHPTILHDLNHRSQYKLNDSKRLRKVLCSTALSLRSIIVSADNPIIVDFTIYDISRSILNSVCKEIGVTYRTLIGSRYREYFLKTDDLGEDIVERMERIEISEIELNKCKVEILEARECRDLLPNHEKACMVNKYSIKTSVDILLDICKRFVLYACRTRDILSICRKYNITIQQMNEVTGPIVATYLNSTLGRIRQLTRLWKIEKFFRKPSSYIYFPMPNTVENSESRFNNGYLSERQVIDILRPYLWKQKLIVKDHRSMIIDRSWRQEKIFRDIYSVIYVSEWSERYSDISSTNLMNSAEFTVVVSGTAGLECAIKGKKHVVLGRPLYKRYFEMKGFKYPEVNALKNYLSGIDSKLGGIVPNNLVAQYLSRCKAYGHSINIYECIKKPRAKQNLRKIKKLANYLLKDIDKPKKDGC